MAFAAKTVQTADSLLGRASLVPLITLFGIPAAGWGALVLLMQIPRLLSGRANPLLFVSEVGSLLTVVALLFVLRAYLARIPLSAGLYRNVLEFLGMVRWHPSVILALLGLLVLPALWILQSEWWIVDMFQLRGWEALTSGDVQDSLDRVVVAYQLGLTSGVPLLFALHMLTRWKPKHRFLPWVFVPVLFLGTAFGVVVLVMFLHQPS